MRSRTLQQASRALQSVSHNLPNRTLPTRVFSASVSSYNNNSNNRSSTPSRTPYRSATSSTTPSKTSTTTTTSTTRQSNTGVKTSLLAEDNVLDPQVAVPEATSVADVDPALAARIPLPNGPSAPSSAFTAALSGSTQVEGNGIDWSSSFHGLSTTPFSPETAAVLMKPLDPLDIEIKPDGIVYLPEIKYRRILNQAFGPGGWGLAPRGELIVGEKVVTREYALIVHGRFIAQARGECQYFSEETIPTAGEGCKSNALLRCCKDLGIASELWDPRYIREFRKQYCQEVWVEHVVNKKRRQIWTRKDGEPTYPYQVVRR
ncbi:mitochondrial genome maintenance MGM101-domain-containing protein [Diplogelasinospora grovesii]|uniref:Mitochondrial genome maintenance protein MGM101 n=1 Tax=Diplogelasinospora grovesii TaxID=303347 RepID=A0AAN6NH81_9PEZI|nr:mitochondrial genome maintenance MGM101-domain-containing protein [Diplogelasinospora grovesii]